MSKSEYPVLAFSSNSVNSARIHLSSFSISSGIVSKSPSKSNCEANLPTLNIFVKTPKYRNSICSGFIWKSSPTCASAAFQNLKHSEPIFLACNATCLPSGPLIFQEPVRPPAPHSRTEPASMPLPRDFDILRPQGSIPSPSIQTFANPGLSKSNVDFKRV